MTRLIFLGHRNVFLAYLVVSALLTSLIGGVFGTAIAASGVANGYRDVEVVTTSDSMMWANYEGTANYTFIVGGAACVVGLILLASISQFIVASVGPTSRSLRLLGTSRLRIRSSLVGAASVAGVVSILLGLFLTPLVVILFRWVIESVGLETADLDGIWMPQSAFVSGLCLLVWALVSIAWQTRHLVGIEPDIPVQRPSRGVLRVMMTPLRYAMGIASAVGLWFLLDVSIDTDNFIEVSLGISICALIVLWSVLPLALKSCGWLLRLGGTGRMVIGGVVSKDSKRLSATALVASLLVVVGGTFAFATLANSTSGAYQSEASLRATAVAAGELNDDQRNSARDADIVATRLDTDSGWLEGEDSVEGVPVHRVDVNDLEDILVSDAVTSGSLEDVGDANVASGDSRYELGDEIVIRDDSAELLRVTVVATLDRNSALGGGITVEAEDFPVSALGQEGLDERTYALSQGNDHIDYVNRVVPGIDWRDPVDLVSESIDRAQEGQLGSLIGMIGGIGLIAVIALLHSVVAYSGELHGLRSKMRRIGFSNSRVAVVFAALGMSIGLAAVVISAVSLWVMQENLSDMLSRLGVTTPMAVPWPLLVGLGTLIIVISVTGMLSRARPRSTATGS